MNAPAPVLDHFREPRNVGRFAAETVGVGRGVAGTAETGDMIKMSVRVAEGRVAEARFQAFGCASAIACASLATELVAGRSVEQAGRLDPATLVDGLGLAPDKQHYAALAAEAVRAAIADWQQRKGRTP